MKLGGDEHSRETTRTLRLITALIVPVFGLYAMLVATGFIGSSPSDAPVEVVAGLLTIWTLASLFFFLRQPTSRLEQALRITVHHVFTLWFFIMVTGFSQPFAGLYILLMTGSNLYFGRTGLYLSAAALAVGALIDILVHFKQMPEILYETGLLSLAIIFVGFTLIGIVSKQESKRLALLHSQERERLQYDRILTIINNLTDATFSTDDHGKILMYNAACLDLLDTNETLRGRYIGDLFNLTDSQNQKTNLFDVLKEAKRATRRDDLNHTYRDGESIRLEMTFAPIRSSYSLSKRGEEQGGYIIIMRDVTKQKSLEEERDEFISVVSHELRTPITIVEGALSNLDVLLKRPEQPNPKLLATSIASAHDQVLYLAKMVNDLSTLSRAERGVADTPEEINIEETLHTLHHRYEKEAQTRKLHLDLDLGAKLGTITVSRLYFEELLQNFITNALKYTKHGSVTIMAKRTKNTVKFTVKDTGVGISRSEQNKIFNKFYRSEDYRIRETNGTGLGLYVSLKLAHKLHTRIELKSRLNHGSAFSFELPVDQGEHTSTHNRG